MNLSFAPEFGYVPPTLYCLLAAFTLERQLQFIPDRRASLLDARMATNLTLAGFSFTVVSLIVTLYQSKLEVVFAATYFFSLSLAYFFLSYFLLFLRLRRLFDTLSDGMTLSGLWVTIAGFMALFSALPPLDSVAGVFVVPFIALSAYVLFDIRMKWTQRKETEV